MRQKHSVLRTIPAWVWFVAFLPGLFAQATNLGASLQSSEPDRVFIGARHQARDYAVYMASARYYGDTGDRGAPNLFVTEPQDGRMVMSYLWAVGQLSSITGLDVSWTWRILGLLSCWIFFLLVWLLARKLLPDKESRDTAFFFACFSGGLGWIYLGLSAAALPDLSTDVKELNEFWNWSTMGSTQVPMWCAGHAIFLGALLMFWNGKSEDYEPHALRPLFLAMLLVACFFVHPYTAITAFTVLGLLTAWHIACAYLKREKPPYMSPVNAVVGLLMAGASIASILFWAREDPVYAKTMEMSSQWHPHYRLLWLPLMYGLPLVFAIWALVKRQGSCLWLGIWLLAAFILTLVPFWPGVKFQYLVHLPICFLAAIGFVSFKRKMLESTPMRWGRGLRVLLAILLFGATPAELMRSVATAKDAPASFVPRAQLRLLETLNDLPDGAVMTSFQGGLWIPWKSGKPVFFGHWFMSYDFKGRSEAMYRFWNDKTPTEEKVRFIKAQRIRYLVVDPWTKEMGSVSTSLGAEKKFDNRFGEIWVLP